MNELTICGLAVGAVFAVLGLLALGLPGICRKLVGIFPRNIVAAGIITAIDLVWVASLIYFAPFLDAMPVIRKAAVLLTPVFFFMLVFLLDELLAPRALGGLLLLVPAPILNAARWHDSPWRFVLTVLAYVLVVTGMTLILSPYRFRQVMAVLMATDNRSRLVGGISACFGIAVLALSLLVY
jgi:uncharacterized protein YjeT (DUF2065 family)